MVDEIECLLPKFNFASGIPEINFAHFAYVKMEQIEVNLANMEFLHGLNCTNNPFPLIMEIQAEVVECDGDFHGEKTDTGANKLSVISIAQ